jgi:hypothetical protein
MTWLNVGVKIPPPLGLVILIIKMEVHVAVLEPVAANDGANGGGGDDA